MAIIALHQNLDEESSPFHLANTQAPRRWPALRVLDDRLTHKAHTEGALMVLI